MAVATHKKQSAGANLIRWSAGRQISCRLAGETVKTLSPETGVLKMARNTICSAADWSKGGKNGWVGKFISVWYVS